MFKINTPYEVGDTGLVIMFDKFSENHGGRNSVVLHAWADRAYLFELWRKWDKSSQLSNIGGVNDLGVIADDLEKIADYILVAGRCAEAYMIWANQKQGFLSPLVKETLLTDQLIPDRSFVFTEASNHDFYLWSPEISGS